MKNDIQVNQGKFRLSMSTKSGRDQSPQRCGECRGLGVLIINIMTRQGKQVRREPCPVCRGTGKR